jgi:hypothetical protein
MVEPFIHAPENERRIDELFVFLSIDGEGRNGVCAEIVAPLVAPLGAVQLVTASPRIAEYYKKLAADLARRSGKRVGMFTFKRGDMTWSVSAGTGPTDRARSEPAGERAAPSRAPDTEPS